MAAPASAVAMYTLVELSRRRLLVLFVLLECMLLAGLGIAPLVVHVAPTADERSLVVLSALSGTIGPALVVCAIGVGMTAVRNDLDSGAIVAILAKPVSRLGYAGGKLAAAVVMLIALGGLFAAGSETLLALNGGRYLAVAGLFFAVLIANALIWMVVVMVLTVHLHNVVAAVLALAMLFLQGVFGELHTLVQSSVITNRGWMVLGEAGYWLLPRPLATNLEREVAESSMRLHSGNRVLVPLTAIPGASSLGDVGVWSVYLAAVCVLLYLTLRRKQV